MTAEIGLRAGMKWPQGVESAPTGLRGRLDTGLSVIGWHQVRSGHFHLYKEVVHNTPPASTGGRGPVGEPDGLTPSHLSAAS